MTPAPDYWLLISLLSYVLVSCIYLSMSLTDLSLTDT